MDLRIRGGQEARRPSDAKHAASAAHRKGFPVRRLLTSLVTVVILLGLAAPVVLAAGPVGPTSFDTSGFRLLADGTRVDTGRVVISLDGPVDVPAGESLDTLVVANGDATIAGDVRHAVIVDGTLTATGATIGSLTVIDATADLGPGTTVTGNVSTLNGTVSTAQGATVVESVRSFDAAIGAVAISFGLLMFVVVLGGALLVLVLALFLAGLAARQMRSTESLITREPGPVILAGIVGAIVLPAIAGLLIITVIGAPIGLAMLFLVLPAMAFLGWLVAAFWVGEWIVARTRGGAPAERPYLAAVVGVIVLAVAGMLPFVSMIATLFGFGAVVLATWRVMRGRSMVAGPAPTAGPGTGGYPGPTGPGSTPPTSGGSGPSGGLLWDPTAPTAAWPAPAPATPAAWPAPADAPAALPAPAPASAPAALPAPSAPAAGGATTSPAADPSWPTLPPAGASWQAATGEVPAAPQASRNTALVPITTPAAPGDLSTAADVAAPATDFAGTQPAGGVA